MCFFFYPEELPAPLAQDQNMAAVVMACVLSFESPVKKLGWLALDTVSAAVE